VQGGTGVIGSPPEGYEVITHKQEGGAMMFILLMITIIAVTIVLATVTYLNKGTFIEKIKFKAFFLELEIHAKQKNDPPEKKSRSNFK
jgi:hypothetical protein